MDGSMECRLVDESDLAELMRYFDNLSQMTKSYYGPHSFDEPTLAAISKGNYENYQAFVAIHNKRVVGYTVIKKGYSEGELFRFPGYEIALDPDGHYLLAPSMSDAYQSRGFGTLMLSFIENYLKSIDATHLILWGGVQTRNQKAIRYYQKNGFTKLGEFHHEGLDNWDMVKAL